MRELIARPGATRGESMIIAPRHHVQGEQHDQGDHAGHSDERVDHAALPVMNIGQPSLVVARARDQREVLTLGRVALNT